MKRSKLLVLVLALGGCEDGGGTSPPDGPLADAPNVDAPVVDASPDARPPDAGPDARNYTDEELEAGAVVYRANCSTCHGPELNGGGESWVTGFGARDLAGIDAESIAEHIRHGTPPDMPAFHESEISLEVGEALGVYIESLPDGYRAPPAFDEEVVMRDHDPWFFPMQIRIEPGQTIRFTNEGATYHDASQLEWVASGGKEGFGSGQMGPSGTFTFTFDKAGSYTVICKDHPYMRGEVHVGEDFEAPTHEPSVPLSVPTRAGVGEVWVTAQWQDQTDGEGDGVVHVIDASTWTDVAQIDVGNNPHNLWGVGGTQIVATNWFDNTLTIIDADARAVEEDRNVGATPAHVMSNEDGSVVWVSIEGSYYVEAVSPETWSPILGGRVFLSGNMPHGLGHGAGRLLVANSMTDDASVIDTELGEELALIPTGRYPLGAAVTPDGARGFVGNCLDETVSILDLDAGEKVMDVVLGGCVVQTSITTDGTKAVVAHGANTAILNVADGSIIVDLVETGKGAHGVAIGLAEDGGTLAYVTHKYDNHIAVIDVDAGEHLGDIPLSVAAIGNSAIVGVTDTGGQGVYVRVP